MRVIYEFGFVAALTVAAILALAGYTTRDAWGQTPGSYMSGVITDLNGAKTGVSLVTTDYAHCVAMKDSPEADALARLLARDPLYFGDPADPKRGSVVLDCVQRSDPKTIAIEPAQ